MHRVLTFFSILKSRPRNFSWGGVIWGTIFTFSHCSVALSPSQLQRLVVVFHDADTRTRLDPQMHVCVQRRWAAASPWSGKTGRCGRRETSWEGNPGVAVHVLGASLPWEQLTQGAENNGGRHISQLALGQLRLWALVKLHLDGSQTRTNRGLLFSLRGKMRGKSWHLIWMDYFQKGLIGGDDRTTAGTEIDGDGTVARVKDSG